MSLRRWLLASDLLSELSQQGVTLWAEQERLRFRAPGGVLTESQRGLLLDLKPEMLDLLNERIKSFDGCTIRSFVVNPFREKSYVCHSRGEAVIIDPGCCTAGEESLIIDYIESNGLTVSHFLLTHAHIDHFYGGAALSRRYHRALRMHPEDIPLLKMGDLQAMMVGSKVEEPPRGELLQDGDTIEFGEVSWQALHCPGHSPGSLCFHDRVNKFVLTGDVLFRGTVGNVYMPGGSLAQLLASIESKLLPLPDDTIVYPGHGPVTTIGIERTTNTWLPGSLYQ